MSLSPVTRFRSPLRLALAALALTFGLGCTGGSGGDSGDDSFSDLCSESCEYIDECFDGFFDRDACEDGCEDQEDVRDDVDDADCEDAQEDYLDCLLDRECSEVVAGAVCVDEFQEIATQCVVEDDDDDDGGGPPAPDLGELDFSGADVTAGDVPGTYDPIVAVPTEIAPVLSVAWGSAPGDSFTLTVISGEVSRILYGQASGGGVFFYQLDCPATSPPAACGDISVDLGARTLTLDGVVIPDSPFLPGTNEATAPVTADGTLTW